MKLIMPKSYTLIPFIDNPVLHKYESDLAVMDVTVRKFIDEKINASTKELATFYEDFIGTIKEQDELTIPLLLCIDQNYQEQPEKPFTIEEILKKTGARHVSENAYNFYSRALTKSRYPVYAAFLYSWIRSIIAAASEENINEIQYLITDIRRYFFALQTAEKRQIEKIRISNQQSIYGRRGAKNLINQGEITQQKILTAWNDLETNHIPKRYRASKISDRVGVSATQVRKHLRTLDQDQKIKYK